MFESDEKWDSSENQDRFIKEYFGKEKVRKILVICEYK